MSNFNLRRHFAIKAKQANTIVFAGRRIKITDDNRAQVEKLRDREAERCYEQASYNHSLQKRIAA